MSGLRKHGMSAYSRWGCRCDVCLSAYRASLDKRSAANALARPARLAAKAAKRLIRQAELRLIASEQRKADRKARPEFYKEKDRLDRERNGAKRRERAFEKRRRIAAERKIEKEAARPAKEAAAKARASAKAKERYAALKRDHPEVVAARKAPAALWRAENRERLLVMRRAYYKKNKAKITAQNKEYLKKARAAGKTTASVAARRRRKMDPCFRIVEGMRKRFRKLLTPLQRESVRTIKLTGCTRAELRAHIEAQFSPGMSWGNYGAWHVDHIKPCAAFDMSVAAERQSCFHYSNLRPLWAEINVARGCSLTFDVDYELSQTPYPS